jgi:hypothetical protein
MLNTFFIGLLLLRYKQSFVQWDMVALLALGETAVASLAWTPCLAGTRRRTIKVYGKGREVRSLPGKS